MAHRCAGCSTTAGVAGCPEHGSNTLTPTVDVKLSPPGVNMYITNCRHGLDLRLFPRCYLCRPVPDRLIEAAIRIRDKRTLADDGASDGYWISRREMRYLEEALAEVDPANIYGDPA